MHHSQLYFHLFSVGDTLSSRSIFQCLIIIGKYIQNLIKTFKKYREINTFINYI